MARRTSGTNDIEVTTDQRIDFLGKTGSGKTTLASHFLRPVRRLIVLDPKGTLTTPDWRLEADSPVNRRSLSRGDYLRIRIPAPLNGDWTDILSFAMSIGDVVVYIDEVYGVVPFGKRAPDELVALYTRGRERNIGVWAASQRPMWIPLFVLSEADWLFIFRLQVEQDRRRVAEIAGEAVINPVSDEHGFFYYNALWETARYSEGLKLGKKGKVTA